MRRRNNLGRTIIIWCLVIAAAGGSVVAGIRMAAAREQPKVIYEYGEVARGDVTASISLTGVVQVQKIVAVKTRMGGRLLKLNVDEGSHVKKGDVIAVVRETDAQTTGQAHSHPVSPRIELPQTDEGQKLSQDMSDAKLAEDKITLMKAQARVFQAQEQACLQPSLCEAAVTSAGASLDAAWAALTLCKSVTVPKRKASVQANYDQAKATLEAAQSDNAQEQDQLAKGFPVQQEADNAECALKQAQAQMHIAKVTLDTLDDETTQMLYAAREKVHQAELAVDAAQLNRSLEEQTLTEFEAAQATELQAEAFLITDSFVALQNGNTAGQTIVSVPAHTETMQPQNAARQQGPQGSVTRGQEPGAEGQRSGGRDRGQGARGQGPGAGGMGPETGGRGPGQRDVVPPQTQVMFATLATAENANAGPVETNILAPSDGTVLKRYISAGALITGDNVAAGTTLVNIADTTQLQVSVDVDETDIWKITNGMEVEVFVSAYPTRTFKGVVAWIAPMTALSQTITSIKVLVTFTSTDQPLTPGMTATCKFILDSRTDVINVPNRAVQTDGYDYTVLAVRNGRLISVPVEVGLVGFESTEITSGDLTVGEKIVAAILEPGGGSASFRGNRPTGGRGRRGPPAGGGRGFG